MSRMFSTNFSYKSIDYTAHVLIEGCDEDCVVTVQLPESLHDLVPGGIICYNSQKKIISGGVNDNIDNSIIDSVLDAVEKFENDKPLRDLWN